MEEGKVEGRVSRVEVEVDKRKVEVGSGSVLAGR